MNLCISTGHAFTVLTEIKINKCRYPSLHMDALCGLPDDNKYPRVISSKAV